MEILNIEQIEQLNFTRGFKHPVIREADKLEVGEGIKITQLEWTKKTDPGSYVQQTFRMSRSTKKFCSRKGEGFIIILRTQ